MEGDITVQVALADAKFLRGLDRLEKKSEGFGKRVDKAVGLLAGGFIGVKVFSALSDAVQAAAKANEDYASTFGLIMDQVEATKVAVGSGIFDAFTGVGDFLTGGALTERADAMKLEKLSIADAKKTADAQKALKDKRAAEAEKEAEAARAMAEERERIVAGLEREAEQEELLAAAGVDRLEIEQELLAIGEKRRDLNKNLKGVNPEDAMAFRSDFEAAAARRIGVLEAKRAKEQSDAARAAKDRYRVEVASLEIQQMRARGDQQAADAAEALLEAETAIAEIRERAGLSDAERADLIARTGGLADAKLRALVNGDGPGRGSSADALVGSSTRGTVLAQTFGGGGGDRVGRDLVQLTRDANRALESIKNDMSLIRRNAGSRGAVFN